MPHLYKKPVAVVDKKTGEKVKRKSKKWWGHYFDATGRLRRQPLSADKQVAQTMLNELVLRVDRIKAGLEHPTDQQRLRPLADHVKEFQAYLVNKGVTTKQVGESLSQIGKMIKACKWQYIGDINASSALSFLGDLRRDGRSVQTYNHYLKSMKQFTRWLVRDRRTPSDPLFHVSKLNTATDRRHDRRALSPEEFSRLMDSARTGPKVEGIPGPDRAMIYLVAAWTGFRKGEIGSLTQRSFDLDSDPPTATVAACYSKRRRQDTQVLHPDLVAQLKSWLATKKRLDPDRPLFPISGRVTGGTDRKTHKMMRLDLERARESWLAEATTEHEMKQRMKSDFLAYADHQGRYADFHSCRHLFITSLERAGISPKMAQTLARHSDIRLTLQTYTHVELSEQVAAIQSLKGPAGER
ncbi:MAG: tyrosine-type recombinase/integrase [Pirellulales bacterium]